MADNSSIPVAVGNETFANHDIGGTKYPRVRVTWGPSGVTNDADVATGKPLPVQLRGSDGTDRSNALPVSQSGTWNIGTITTLPTIPAGNNNIGDVDIVTVPADPFGVNADAAAVAGSISAKLRALATAIGTGVITRGAGATDANTIRVSLATEQIEGGEYEDVAASQSSVMMGATGAQGDFLSSVLVIPESLNPGAITLQDGNITAVTIFAGGTGSVSNLIPFSIPFGHSCVSATTPGWKITTGASVHVRAIGNFT